MQIYRCEKWANARLLLRLPAPPQGGQRSLIEVTAPVFFTCSGYFQLAASTGCLGDRTERPQGDGIEEEEEEMGAEVSLQRRH